jgi:hypothetical protein
VKSGGWAAAAFARRLHSPALGPEVARRFRPGVVLLFAGAAQTAGRST